MEHREERDVLRFVEAWRVAGQFMERDRAQRLRSMTDDQCRAAIARIFSGAPPRASARPTGLIEQQRYFRKLG